MKLGLVVVLLACIGVVSAQSACADIAQAFICPGNIALVTGATQQFRVFALDAEGNEVPAGPVVWSADPSLGTVDQSGFFRAGSSIGRSALGVRVVLSNGFQAGAVVEVLPLNEQAGMVLDHVWKPGSPGCFDQWPKIAADSSSLYVTDGHSVQRFSATGSYAGMIESFGPGKAINTYPSAFATRNGSLYALCGDRVALFTSAGQLVREYAPPPGYGLQARGVAVDSSANVYIAAGGVVKLNLSGDFVKAWQTWSSQADYVACIGSYIYVVCNLIPLSCDCPMTRIQRFSRDGDLLNEWGETGHGDGQFWVAGGIAGDSLGRVYIVDKGNRRVQVFTPQGVYVRQWSVDDGVEYSYPEALASDSLGRFYVTYSASYSPVRQYSSTGSFMKVVGLSPSNEQQPRSPSAMTASFGGFLLNDSESRRMFVLDAEGNALRTWPTLFSNTTGRYITGSPDRAYVWDSTAKRICGYDSSGNRIVDWPLPSATIRSLRSGRGGHLFVADTLNNLYVLDEQGNLVDQWNTQAASLGDFAPDRAGYVYVTGGGQLTKFAESGEFIGQWSGNNPGTVAASGDVVLTGEWQTRQLVRYDAGGRMMGTWKPSDSGRYSLDTSSICFDDFGNPHIVDSLNDRVYSLTLAATTVPADRTAGSFIYLKDMAVTAGSEDLGDCFYVESKDRSSGIRVTGQTAARGDVVTVAGSLAIRNGEREIVAASVTAGSEKVYLAPLGMKPTDVGCGQGPTAPWAWRWVYNPETRTSDYKWIQLIGLTHGLLLKTWGRVESSDPTDHTFVITDGNQQYLKCRIPFSEQIPAVDAFVSVTGVSASELNDDAQPVPVLVLRSESDVRVYSE